MATVLWKIQQSEGKHFGSRFVFIAAWFFIIELETIIRGNTEKSLLGIQQWTVGNLLNIYYHN